MRRVPNSLILLTVVVLLAGLAVVGVYRTSSILFKPSLNPARARYVSSGQTSAAGHVNAAFWIDRVRVYQDQPVQINLSFTNEGSTAANGLEVDLQSPGLEQTGPCWINGYPACQPGVTTPAALPASIQPGESIHLHAALTPPEAGRFGLLAIYRWTEAPELSKDKTQKDKAAGPPKSPQTYVRAVTIDQLDVTTRIDEFLAWAASWLALPLIVGIGGAIWQLWAGDREKEFQVWKEQLANLFKYIPQYYLPIARANYNFRRAVADLTGTAAAARTPDQRLRVMHFFVMYWMRMRSLREKMGWFLSTKSSERLLPAIWDPLLHLLRAKVDLKRIDELCDALRKPVSLSRFELEFTAPPAPLSGVAAPAVPPPGSNAAAFTAARTELLNWVEAAAPNNALTALICLMAMQLEVLAFEWDRPFYGYWYRERPSFDLDEFRGHMSTLDSLAAGLGMTDKVSRLNKMAEIYGKSVKRYRAR